VNLTESKGFSRIGHYYWLQHWLLSINNDRLASSIQGASTSTSGANTTTRT